MLKSIGILIIAAIIVYIEVPSLLKKKYKKELIVFSIILTIGVGMSIAHSFGKSIPNPIDFLTFIFMPLHDAITR